MFLFFFLSWILKSFLERAPEVNICSPGFSCSCRRPCAPPAAFSAVTFKPSLLRCNSHLNVWECFQLTQIPRSPLCAPRLAHCQAPSSTNTHPLPATPPLAPLLGVLGAASWGSRSLQPGNRVGKGWRVGAVEGAETASGWQSPAPIDISAPLMLRPPFCGLRFIVEVFLGFQLWSPRKMVGGRLGQITFIARILGSWTVLTILVNPLQALWGRHHFLMRNWGPESSSTRAGLWI